MIMNAPQAVASSAEIVSEEERVFLYKTHFNDLRQAVKYNNLTNISKIKKKLSPVQFKALLGMGNVQSRDATLMHYAAQYNRPEAINKLVEGLTLSEQLQLFKIHFTCGKITSMYFAVDHGSFEAACAIKNILYPKEKHKAWVELLLTLQRDEETPVHQAARCRFLNFIELFSDGLSANEWFSIISKKYINTYNRYNVLAVYFINLRNDEAMTNFSLFIKLFQHNLSSELWLELLIANTTENNTKRDEATIEKLLKRQVSETLMFSAIQEVAKALSLDDEARLKAILSSKSLNLWEKALQSQFKMKDNFSDSSCCSSTSTCSTISSLSISSLPPSFTPLYGTAKMIAKEKEEEKKKENNNSMNAENYTGSTFKLEVG